MEAMSWSVPPLKMKAPWFMKLEKTMPKVMAGSSRVEPLAKEMGSRRKRWRSGRLGKNC